MIHPVMGIVGKDRKILVKDIVGIAAVEAAEGIVGTAVVVGVDPGLVDPVHVDLVLVDLVHVDLVLVDLGLVDLGLVDLVHLERHLVVQPER